MRITRALVAAAVAASLLATIPSAGAGAATRSSRKTLPALTGVKTDALTRALDDGGITEAEYALERAKSLFQLRDVRSRFGAVARPNGREATLLLRDLKLRAANLTGDDRSAADAILARPDDDVGEPYGQPYKDGATVEVICGAGSVELCVHYVSAGDNNNETDPTWAAATLAEMTTVWTKELDDFGFRQPKGDANSDNNGGDERTDVYLADIGSDGVYGYCSSDDPGYVNRNNVSAYCVLDNDYSLQEFPNLGPLENMQVTAAHEFNHASQFAYDYYDDSWFLEGTAAWVEDMVYDDVNDNYQYLLSSPATMPNKAVDFTNNGSGFINRYGSWYFWRYITELFSGTPGQADASLMVRMWEKADAASGGPDQYSLQAASTIVAEEGSSMKNVYRSFAATAFAPDAFFEEGADYLTYLAEGDDDPFREPFNTADGGRPKTALNKTLTPGTPSASKTVILDHLSSAYFAFRPGTGTTGSSSIKLKVNGPLKSHGTTASAFALDANDQIIGSTEFFSLNSDGDGSLTLGFDPATVARVIVVASNASTKFKNCFEYNLWPTQYSCGGEPKFDDQSYFVKGTLK
jgi:hypothetical protein